MDAHDRYETGLVVIAEAFADILENPTAAGTQYWTQDQMEQIAVALENIEHPKAAVNLRDNWWQRERSKITK